MIPTVSVVVPVYNAERNISYLIESLLNIDYPKKNIEIIIVDNRSTDMTKTIAKQYPIKLLEENNIQSSYAARNKGIEHVKNEIIAFTDADCIVTPQWVKEGVKALSTQPADLAGGKIEYFFSNKKSAAEYYDSLTYMQNEVYILEKGVAATANLFVRHYLFEKIGLFPVVKSGGDGLWTAKATSKGFTLIYASKAVIKHPARPFKPLIKKGYRVGKGAIPKKFDNGDKSRTIIIEVLGRILPSKISSIKKMINERGSLEMRDKLYRIWGVTYACRLSVGIGLLIGLFTFSEKNAAKNKIL